MSLFSIVGKSVFGMEEAHEKLIRLLDEAQALTSELEVYDSLEANSPLRNRLIESSKRLARNIQTPVDHAWDIFFQPHHLSVLRTALDAGWLQIISNAGDPGISISQLATSTQPQADRSLVQRLMRVLTSAGTVKEIGYETYASTGLVKLVCTPQWGAGLRHASRDYALSVAKMPEYFAEKGYKQPLTAEDGLYSHAYGIPFLHHLNKDPPSAIEFNMFMTTLREDENPWTGVLPIAEMLYVASEQDVLLVDIGGGLGHELAAFSAAQQRLNLKGRLILEDLPRVTEQVSAKWQGVFEILPHDFFSPQPVVAARAYYLRHILHGWPDKDAVSILRSVRDAMRPGYSKLLINEIVVPDTGCGFWEAAFDVSMMAVVNGRLRTESGWKDLIGAFGDLRLEKIWEFGTRRESIIEVVRE